MGVKNIDGLMRHLRDNHNIAINGSGQKRKLRNIGYYHGYKGYRYIYRTGNKVNIPYTDFNQIMSVNTFDIELKSIFYPQLMFIETALKNYVLEILLLEGKTADFEEIYEELLTCYKNESIGSKQYKKLLGKRLELKNKIHSKISQNYNYDKEVIQHFYHKNENVPIWAISEVIELGVFGNFVACTNNNIKRSLALSLNFNISFDTDGKMSERIIFLIKDLRNSVAHNDVVFDCRFRKSNINKGLMKFLEKDTNISNIDFTTITDYLILVIFLQKQMGTSKTALSKIVSRYESTINNFRKEVPLSIYNQIFRTDNRSKINLLKVYIKK